MGALSRAHRSLALGPVRAVLFDLDGTLLDSADLITTAFQDTCRAHLGQEIDRDAVLRTWSLPIRQRFHALAPDRDEFLAQAYVQRYLALHDRLARLFPAIPHVLDTLRRRGFALGIVTSKRRPTTQASVDAFDLTRWCAVVITDEDVEQHKPDPEPVYAAARALGVAVSRTLMVGDSTLDIAAGRRAGARTAAALWGSVTPEEILAEGPDCSLDRPEDLLLFCRHR